MKTLVPLAVVASVGLSACGSSDKKSDTPTTTTQSPAQVAATFKQGYAKERVKLNRVSERIGTVITQAADKTDAQILAQLKDVETQYRTALTQLDALKPPPNLETRFTAATSAAHLLDADLVTITSAAASHDAKAAEAATRKLVTDVPVLKTAAEALRSELGLPAEQ
jgi:hypothetical protein